MWEKFTVGEVAVSVTKLAWLVQVMFWNVGDKLDTGASVFTPMAIVCVREHPDWASDKVTVKVVGLVTTIFCWEDVKLGLDQKYWCGPYV